MRFALLFLACFVAVSQQQNYFASWPIVNPNWAVPQQPFPYPLLRSSPQPAVASPRHGDDEHDEHKEHKDEEHDKEEHHSGIYHAIDSLIHQHNEHKIKVVTDYVHKVREKVIKGVLISTELCLDRRLFSTVHRNFKPHVLDRPCVVDKKPGEDHDDDDKKDEDFIRKLSPSRVLPLQASRGPVVVFEDQSTMPFKVFQQLVSSKDEVEKTTGPVADEDEKRKPHRPFDPYAATVTKTVYKVKTKYELKQRTVQKTVHLAERPGVLACLPEGHVICRKEHDDDKKEHDDDDKKEQDAHGGAVLPEKPAPTPEQPAVASAPAAAPAVAPAAAVVPDAGATSSTNYYFV